jgi:hypothetical protein
MSDRTGGKRLAERRGEVLFIDACGMGAMVDRTERILTDDTRLKKVAREQLERIDG